MFPTFRMVLVFVLLGVPGSVIGIIWSVLRGNVFTMYRWAMAVLRLGVEAAGVRVHVEGLGNIPEGKACIFMSNHVSNLDPPVLLPRVPGMTTVFLKKGLMRIPLLGTVMRMGRFIPVARGQSRQDAMTSVRAAKEALAAGLHITVFPEGTRSTTGVLLPFKKGGFFLAVETGAPLIPVAVSGTERMMPKGSPRIAPGKATVHFLPMIDPAAFGSNDELAEAVRSTIAAALERDRSASAS